MDIHGKAIGNPWVIDGNPSDSGYGSNGWGYLEPFVKTPVVSPERTGISYKKQPPALYFIGNSMYMGRPQLVRVSWCTIGIAF